MFTVALAIIAYSISAVALALISIRARELYLKFKAGQPDPTRSANRKKRLSNTLYETLAHSKMLNFTGTGIAHWFVMIGFVTLL